MDDENLKLWAARPDACRCCLSACGTWNINQTRVTEFGVKEMYSDILLECYGITLSDSNSEKLACEMCIVRLRDVNEFRKQVLHAEEIFVQYHQALSKTQEIKMEVDSFYPDGLVNDGLSFSDDENKETLFEEDDPIKTEQDTEVKRKTRKHIKKPKVLKKKAVKIKKKKIKDGADEKIINEVDGDIQGHVIMDTRKTAKKGPQQAVSKQISERKRVILTCENVLSETTACPFRHHRSWFQCFYCSEDFMDIDTLKNHNKNAHGDIGTELKKMKRYPRSLQIEISNIECRKCRVNLTDVNEMHRHLEEVHKKVIFKECIADYKVNSSPYSCHLCFQQFHVFRTLTTHLNEHYANCICDVCGRSFINSKRLKVHKRSHEKGIFPCTECGKILNTQTSKLNHIQSAHSKRTIKCQICFKPMKHYNDRIKHMSEVHDITHKFKCHICFKEYNVKHYLATHIRQTHGNKNKKCHECGMAFVTNHGLKKHMIKHTGEKAYKCGVCGKAYARNYTLREHMRAHEGF